MLMFYITFQEKICISMDGEDAKHYLIRFNRYADTKKNGQKTDIALCLVI